MRKVAIVLLFLSFFFSTLPQPIQAAVGTCQDVQQGFGVELQNGVDSHTVSMGLGDYTDGDRFQFKIERPGDGSVLADTPFFTVGEDGEFSNDGGTVTIQGDRATWVITKQVALEETNSGNYTAKREVSMYEWPGFFGANRQCNLGTYTAAEFSTSSTDPTCQIYAYQTRDGEKCYSGGCMNAGVDTHIEASGLKEDETKAYTGDVYFSIDTPDLLNTTFSEPAQNGTVTGEFNTNKVGTYSITLIKLDGFQTGSIICKKFSFEAVDECAENLCGEKTSAYLQQSQPNFDLCEQVSNSDAKDKCQECIGGVGTDGTRHIWTAIGCIPTEAEGIIKTLITLGLSLGGGVTLLLILAGAFRYSISAGDPKAAEEAREQITSAVIGLLFIIFSIVILRFIGIQVLQIPGLGGT
jgi:hypothetical protein